MKSPEDLVAAIFHHVRETGTPLPKMSAGADKWMRGDTCVTLADDGATMVIDDGRVRAYYPDSQPAVIQKGAFEDLVACAARSGLPTEV